MKCPCQSGKDYEDCCEPFHQGTKSTPTAEATMRARYSAFANGVIDYIRNTYNPEDRENFDEKSVSDWSQNSKWNGLEIINLDGGLSTDNEGIVEFKARYEARGIQNIHHEIAQFKKIDGKWYFMDGQIIRDQIIRAEPKVGRNDPCPCGSGKKFKKCCLNK